MDSNGYLDIMYILADCRVHKIQYFKSYFFFNLLLSADSEDVLQIFAVFPDSAGEVNWGWIQGAKT